MTQPAALRPSGGERETVYRVPPLPPAPQSRSEARAEAAARPTAIAFPEPSAPRQEGPKAGARLMMPRLGEPVEPAYANPPTPWWRSVDTVAPLPRRDEPEPVTLPKEMPWPMD